MSLFGIKATSYDEWKKQAHECTVSPYKFLFNYFYLAEAEFGLDRLDGYKKWFWKTVYDHGNGD